MSLQLARLLAESFTNEGVRTVTDPKNVVTPCVLLTPPVRTYDVHCGYTATQQAYALAAGGGGEASWQALDELVDQLAELVDVETVTPTAWRASEGEPPIPAYLVTFTSTITTEE